MTNFKKEENKSDFSSAQFRRRNKQRRDVETTPFSKTSLASSIDRNYFTSSIDVGRIFPWGGGQRWRNFILRTRNQENTFLLKNYKVNIKFQNPGVRAPLPTPMGTSCHGNRRRWTYLGKSVVVITFVIISSATRSFVKWNMILASFISCSPVIGWRSCRYLLQNEDSKVGFKRSNWSGGTLLKLQLRDSANTFLR